MRHADGVLLLWHDSCGMSLIQPLQPYTATDPLHDLMIQVEKLKAWQAAQEREASSRPEAKQWIDPAIIERCVLVDRVRLTFTGTQTISELHNGQSSKDMHADRQDEEI